MMLVKQDFLAPVVITFYNGIKVAGVSGTGNLCHIIKRDFNVSQTHFRSLSFD